MKARGNITVDFAWKDGKVINYALYAPKKQRVKVMINGKMIAAEVSGTK
jgi:alpha-L-fucosidase 2